MMQSGRWFLLLLDLIGGGAVSFALIYVIALRRFVRKRLAERGASHATTTTSQRSKASDLGGRYRPVSLG